MLRPFRYAVSFSILPFILVGAFTSVMIYSGKPKADGDVSTWRLFVIGLAVLADSGLIVIWVDASLFGILNILF